MSLQATLETVSAIRQALADPASLVGTGGALAGGTEGPSQASSADGESSFAAKLEQASAGYESASGASSTDTAQALDSGDALGSGEALDTADALGSGAAGAASGAVTSDLGSQYQLQDLDGVVGSSALSPLEAAGQGTVGQRIVAIAESQLGQTEQPPGSNESPAIAQYRSATAGAIPGAPWCAYFASWVARQAGEPIGEGGQGAGAVSEVWSWAQSSGRAIVNGPGVVPKPGDLIVFGDEHVGIVRDVLPDGQIQTIEGNYENKVAANVRSPTEATGYVEMS
jgi:CHAP domain